MFLGVVHKRGTPAIIRTGFEVREDITELTLQYNL